MRPRSGKVILRRGGPPTSRPYFSMAPKSNPPEEVVATSSPVLASTSSACLPVPFTQEPAM